MTIGVLNSSLDIPDGVLIGECQKREGQQVLSSTPRVSIVIPAYNVAGYIVEALESIFSQSFKNYEIILINDGSPDTELFERHIEPYIENLVYLKINNAGAGPARNIAISHARGEVIAFLDGDDIWTSNFLESQINFLDKNNYDMVYSDGLIFGDPIMSGRKFSQDAPSEGDVSFESLLDLRCNVLLSSTLARKQAIINAGAFEWKRVRAQDFNLWLRMAQSGARIAYQKETLVKYRMRLSSLSGDSVMRIDREINSYGRIKQTFKLNDSHLQIIEKHLRRLEAEKEIQLGKSFLLGGDYYAARKAFIKGNEYRKSLKLSAVITALQVAPGLFLRFYKSLRRAEIDYLPELPNSPR